jgi:hypothetical protein
MAACDVENAQYDITDCGGTYLPNEKPPTKKGHEIQSSYDIRPGTHCRYGTGHFADFLP